LLKYSFHQVGELRRASKRLAADESVGKNRRLSGRRGFFTLSFCVKVNVPKVRHAPAAAPGSGIQNQSDL
jgi:hypothetical protein